MIQRLLRTDEAVSGLMNWFGNQKGEGVEYHLLVIAIGLALLIQGGGKWSLDGWMTKGR